MFTTMAAGHARSQAFYGSAVATRVPLYLRTVPIIQPRQFPAVGHVSRSRGLSRMLGGTGARYKHFVGGALHTFLFFCPPCYH